MNNEEQLSFIHGEFTVEDAREIILNALITKVNYNKLKNISSHERYGKDDPLAIARIHNLNLSIEKFKELLMIAKNENKKLKISSDIKVELSDAI
jgi:hypothetical protein